MPAPSNTSHTTAVDLGTLPADVTQNVYDGGVSYTVWYKYTAVPGENYIGVFAFGDVPPDPYVYAGSYVPYIYVYTLVAGVPTYYITTLNGSQAGLWPDRPIQFPVTPGETYYFEIIADSNVNPSTLRLTAVTAPVETPPFGAIIVNDDAVGFGAAVISSVDGDDYHIYKFISPAPSGEGGDVLASSGRVMLSNRDGDSVDVYESDLTTLVSSSSFVPAGLIFIRSGQAVDRWYAFDRVQTLVNGRVNIYDEDGALLNAIDFGVPLLQSVSPSTDGTILYVIRGEGIGSNNQIKRWDIGSDSFLADLTGVEATLQAWDMLTLADGTIIVLWKDFSSGTTVIATQHDQTTGAVLNTYTISDPGEIPASVGSGYRITHATDDPSSFWVWYHTLDDNFFDGFSIFKNIRVSDGSELSRVQHVEFGEGHYELSITETPLARFGVSASCPFMIARTSPGVIEVTKVTVPDASTQSFDFTAGGGLSPDTFDLLDGETQTFPGVAAGDGYSINEAAVGGWSTSFVVSNGSSPDNLTVAAGETVTVTVTNTQVPADTPTPPPCCSTNETGYSGSGPTGPTGSNPPPTPPVTTPRVVPAGGEAPTYVLCSAGGGRPATASNPTDAQHLVSATTPLVHMKWRLPDASIRRYGKRAFTSGNGQAVSARVLNWGPTRQVLSDRHGSFQANQFTVQLSDYDRALRTILSTTATKYIDGKEIELLIETAANAALGVAPLVLSRGIITGYKFNRDLTVDLTVTDPLGYRYSNTSLDRPIPHRVIGPTFPGCAETSVGRGVPIIYGEMSDDYSWTLDKARIPVGIVPVIHVGKANLISAVGIPGSEWEAFVVCGHALTCVQSVFASNLAEDGEGSVRMSASTYGSEFLVPGVNVPLYYDIVGTDGITQRFCLFFATGERATAHITGKVPITLNVWGIEDVGDGSGDTITELAYQYQHFLQSWVLTNYMSGNWPAVPLFADGIAKIRTTSFDTVNATHAGRLGTPEGYIGAMYIGDQKPAREHNREFMIGGDMRTGVNHHGQVLAMTVKDTSPTTGLTTYTAQDHVVQDSFEISPQVDEIFNVYTYEYGPEPATNRVSGIAQTIRDELSVTNHGERIAQALLYRTTRQKPTADDVAGRTLLRSANAPTDVTFSLDLRGVTLALGQLIRITHYQGIGVSGWTSRVLMVTGITTHPDEDDFSTTIDAEDVQGLLDAGALAMQIDSGQIDVSVVA